MSEKSKEKALYGCQINIGRMNALGFIERGGLDKFVKICYCGGSIEYYKVLQRSLINKE